MVVRTTFIVLGVLLAICLFVVGAMAALGLSIHIDFSSPGPISGPDRPQLEAQVKSSIENNKKLFYIEEAPRFKFKD